MSERSGHVIVLNGGSSAGKSTIGRKLQTSLSDTWLLTGIDVVIWTMPKELEFSAEGFTIENGVFRRGPEFMRLFGAFQASVVAQARDGINLIVEDVFLDGARDQQRWESALGDVMTLWVGVRCAAAVAAAREVARGDRPLGIAANEADSAHEGVHYDLEVDSATMDLKVVVDHITSAVSNRWALGSTPATTSAPATPPRGALMVEGTVSRAPWEH